jgi:PAS domain S-box-containing protein
VLDVTEHRRVHRALIASEARFKAMFSQAAVGIAETDRTGAFVIANQRFCEMLGYDLADLLGLGFQDVTHPEDLQRSQEIHARMVAGEIDGFSIETRYLCRDGATIWARTIVSPVRDAAGEMTHGITVTQDITGRKDTERELARKAQDLARSNADLQQFASVASHDLQEPLRMVTSYLQLIQSRLAGSLDPELVEFMAFAVDGSARMQALINDLLAYSRVTTPGRRSRETDSAKAFRSATLNLRLAIEESSAVITHGHLPTVVYDPTQLTQLLQNLISNALKFCGDGPPRIHVEATAAGEEWVFSVRDHGIGIDPQYARKIFVIFQRLHSRETYPGTGIGLAICKKIVEHHGGRIWVESEPGRGSTFCFTVQQRGTVPP